MAQCCIRNNENGAIWRAKYLKAAMAVHLYVSESAQCICIKVSCGWQAWKYEESGVSRSGSMQWRISGINENINLLASMSKLCSIHR
jgi:hypothetical protein